MSGMTTDPGDKTPAQIEREVEQTRDSVADTLDNLRAKLAPSQMVDQVVEQISDYARSSGGTEFMRNLGTSVRDNPLPVAMIGAGIAWLLLSRGGSTTPSYASQAYSGGQGYRPPSPPRSTAGPIRMGIHDVIVSTREAAESAVEAVGDAVSRAGAMASDAASRAAAMGSDLANRAGELGSDAVERVSSLGQQTMSTVGQRADSMRHMSGGSRGLEDLARAQPLLFGALGLALGATLGAILPRTEAEDRLMGEARDTMAERVGEAARDGIETVREVAGEHLDRVKDTLAETYSETKENLDRGGISGVGQALGTAASDLGRAAEDALRGAVGEVKRGIGETGPRAG